MRILIWPKTVAGRLSAVSTLCFIGLMAIKLSALAMLINLPLPTPLIAASGVIGFLSGVISIIKNKDRALLTMLSVPVGLLIIIWTAAEILSLH